MKPSVIMKYIIDQRQVNVSTETHNFKLIFRHHFNIPEICIRTRIHEKTDSTAVVGAQLQVVHDQDRLRVIVQVKFGLGMLYHDLHFDPFIQSHVGIGFIFSLCFFPQPVELIIRVGKILRGMVPAELVLCPSVGGPDINGFKPAVVLIDPECQTDKAPCSGIGGGQQPAQQHDFNRPVTEIIGVVQSHEGGYIGSLDGCIP